LINFQAKAVRNLVIKKQRILFFRPEITKEKADELGSNWSNSRYRRRNGGISDADLSGPANSPELTVDKPAKRHGESTNHSGKSRFRHAIDANSEEMVAVFAKVMADKQRMPTDLDPVERTRAKLFLTMLRSNFENTFLQHQQGFLPDDFYQEVAVKLFSTYGQALINFNLPLTKGSRAELTRILAEPKQSTDD